MDDELRVTHIEIDGVEVQIVSIPAEDDDVAETSHLHAIQTPIDDEVVAVQIETLQEWEDLISPGGDEWPDYAEFELVPEFWPN